MREHTHIFIFSSFHLAVAKQSLLPLLVIGTRRLIVLIRTIDSADAVKSEALKCTNVDLLLAQDEMMQVTFSAAIIDEYIRID